MCVGSHARMEMHSVGKWSELLDHHQTAGSDLRGPKEGRSPLSISVSLLKCKSESPNKIKTQSLYFLEYSALLF